MTKVTGDMRKAAYKEMENFWGDDIDFEEGGKFDGFIDDLFTAMTAAQDSGEPSFWAWEYVDGAIEQNAIYKSKEQCERHSQADKGKAIPLYLAAPTAVQVDSEDDYNLKAFKKECEGLSLFRYVDGQLVELIDEDFDKLAETVRLFRDAEPALQDTKK